jgi:aryl-alcohol dehydrogenase-like predicted oxidoreductase
MQHRSLGRSGLQVSLVGLGCNNFGGRMDLERTRGVIDKAIAAASNFSAAQLDEAVATSKRIGVAGFVATQEEYSLLVRDIEKAVLPAIKRNGISLVPYFPLASGMLSGKYRKGSPLPAGTRLGASGHGYDRYLTPANWDKMEKLRAFAEGRGHSLLELAMSWLARHPSVGSVIAGATRPEQLEANAKAVDWALSDAEMTEVGKIAA